MGMFDDWIEKTSGLLFGEDATPGQVSTGSTSIDPARRKQIEEMFAQLEGLSFDESPLDFSGRSTSFDRTSLSLEGLDQYTRRLGDGDASYEEELANLIRQGPQDTEDFFNKTVQAPSLKAFERDVLPGISRKFSPSGFYSSERVGSENRAREDLIDSLTRKRADISFGERNRSADRSLRGIGLSRESDSRRQQIISQLLLGRGQLELGEAGLNQGAEALEQQGFFQEQGLRLQDLLGRGGLNLGRDQIMAQLLGIPLQENYATVTGGTPGGGGLAGPLAAGAGLYFGGAGAGWLASLFK